VGNHSIITVNCFKSNAKPNSMLLIHRFYKNLLSIFNLFHLLQDYHRERERTKPGTVIQDLQGKDHFYVPKMNQGKATNKSETVTIYKLFEAKHRERNSTMSHMHISTFLQHHSLVTAFTAAKCPLSPEL